MFQCERPCRKECFRPQIARRVQFRRPFVAQMSRFCAIHGTSDFSSFICCNLDPTDKKRTCSAHLSNKWMPEMESMGDLRSKTLCLACLIGWSSAVTRFLATLQCESIEHMSSLERENRRRIGVPERTTVLKRVFSTRNRTEIPIPASICCSDAPILRYSQNQSLLPPYLLQFRPFAEKTDMLRSSEQQMHGKIGIFGRFAA